MAEIFDALLVIISACSAVYCWTLSRRLRAMQNLKKGMGKAVADLTQSVTEVNSNSERLNRQAAASVTQLGSMLGKVDDYQDRVDVMLETMDRQSRETWKDHQMKSSKAEASLRSANQSFHELMADAKSLSALMNDQIMVLALSLIHI